MNIPALKLYSVNTVNMPTPTHMVIEGDNIDSLTALQETHQNSIDVIITDPPYNTSKTFIYSDNFNSHTNWLNFMRPRLKLAHNLLKDTGLIFINIDDNEFAHLKLLMDEIFGETNFITTLVWIQTSTDFDTVDSETEVAVVGTNLGDVKHAHEYVLVYGKSEKSKTCLLPAETDSIISRVTKAGNNRSRIIFPKGLKLEGGGDKTFTGVIGGASEPITIVSPAMVFKNGVLQDDTILEAGWSVPKMLETFLNGGKVIDRRGQELTEIYFTKTGLPYMRKTSAGVIPSSVLSGYGDTSKWGKELNKIVSTPKNFDYPKPTPMYEKLIQMGSNKKDAVVLDLFAGSGTTGHAVLNLNQNDGGTRKFILLNNNEGGICETITFERVKRVLTGKNWADGSIQPAGKGCLQYYRVETPPEAS